MLADKSDAFLKELCQYHVSGQLKVAPEHVSDRVLKYMGKPENAVYKRFTQRYKAMNEKLGLKQYLVPYLMSSHPGSQLTDAVEMAEHLRDLATCRNRFRIFIRHRPRFQPACITRALIRVQESLFIFQRILMKSHAACAYPIP